MEKTQNFFNRISDLIAQDNLNQAIEELRIILEGSKRIDDIIVQSARYNDVMRQIKRGELNFETSQITKNQIRYALIDMVRSLEDEISKNKEIEIELDNLIKGSNLIMEKLKAKEGIDVKIKQQNSSIKIDGLESGRSINIDINQE